MYSLDQTRFSITIKEKITENNMEFGGDSKDTFVIVAIVSY